MRRDKTMGPIIYKNLETHSVKNMKANLMYSIVITFLVFTGCNFNGTIRYLEQMGSIMFGADITIANLNMQGSHTALEEMPIRQAMESQLEKNGGKVKEYSLVSTSVIGQLSVGGREKLSEFASGAGLQNGFFSLTKLDLNGVERNNI